jgi:hypothetical protein
MERWQRWVNRVILAAGRSLPVYTDKQTSWACFGTSQRCHKPKYAPDLCEGLSVALDARQRRDDAPFKGENLWLGVGKPPRRSSWDWDFSLPREQGHHHGE